MLSGEQMLQRILSDLIRVEGINAAIVVGTDGFVIEQVSQTNVDMDALGAMASTSFGVSMALGSKLCKGNCEHVLVELEQGPIMLTLVSQHEILAVMAAKDVNLGRIRFEMIKYKDRIAAAL